MKKLLGFVFILSGVFLGAPAQAKLSDQQSMKCIDGDKLTRSVFSDLQAAYEMRIVSAKDFLKVMDKPTNCPQLRKDLKNLHANAVSAFPQNKLNIRPGSGTTGPSESRNESYGTNTNPPPVPNFNDYGTSDFDMPMPMPPDFPEGDFDEGFGDF